jgi:hypothetical protein
MADGQSKLNPLLPACHELLELYPDSLRIREQVEALEEAMPDRPGVVVSFCRTIIETTCRTILTDRGITADADWEAPELISETLRYVNLAPRDDGGAIDPKLRAGSDSLVRGLHQIVSGVVEIRNAHGSAAHGADAYFPLLDSRYAEILARATDAVVGLLFKTHLGSARRDPLARFRYGDHSDFDELVDSIYGPFKVLEVQLIASEALFRTDFQAYRAGLVQFRQEQQQQPILERRLVQPETAKPGQPEVVEAAEPAVAKPEQAAVAKPEQVGRDVPGAGTETAQRSAPAGDEISKDSPQ